MPRKNYVNFRITDERRERLDKLVAWLGYVPDEHAAYVQALDYALRNNPIVRPVFPERTDTMKFALEEIASGPCCQTPGCCVEYPKCDTMTARAALAE